MKKLLIILSLAGMTSLSMSAAVQQVKLSNPPSETKVTSYSGIGKMSSVGDLNQDGKGDFAIAGAGATNGPVVVIYGSNNLPSALVLNQIQQGNLAGQGFNVSYVGYATGIPSTPLSVTSADLNGDGKLDLASLVSEGGSFNAVILFGPEGFNQNNPNLMWCEAIYNYAFPTAGIQGCVADLLGSSYRNFERLDFNKDGKDDFLYTTTTTNRAVVMFGAATYQNQTLLPSSVGSGPTSPQVAVVTNSTLSAALGDVSGDSIADFIAGTFTNATGSIANVYYGSSSYGQNATGVTTPTSFDSLVLLTGGIVQFVAGAGDINGDGTKDILVGNSGSTAPDGRIYVVYGKNGGVGPVTLDSLAGNAGFVIYEASFPGCNGFTATSAGDMNGDGIGDLVINAGRSGPFASCINALALVYVVYGKSGGYTNVYLNNTSTFDGLVILYDGISTNCPTASSCDFTKGGSPAQAISLLGDVDGNGADDIAIAYGTGATSASFIVYGVNSAATTTTTGGPLASESSELGSFMAIFF